VYYDCILCVFVLCAAFGVIKSMMIWGGPEGPVIGGNVVVKTFLGLKTKTETLDFRSRDQDQDRDLDKMNSSALESRDHGLEITTLAASIPFVTEHSLKGATNYGNRATGVGTKHAVLRPRPRPGPSGLETKTETLDFRSRDRDLDKMNSSALESRDHGLEITTLIGGHTHHCIFHSQYRRCSFISGVEMFVL